MKFSSSKAKKIKYFTVYTSVSDPDPKHWFTRCFFTSFAILTPWIEGVRRVASFTPPKLFKWSLRTERFRQLAIFLVEKDKNS